MANEIVNIILVIIKNSSIRNNLRFYNDCTQRAIDGKDNVLERFNACLSIYHILNIKILIL